MPDIPVIVFLCAAGFFAGLVDSIAGGGGLISLPALLAAGLPPHTALATNKVQSAIGTTISAGRYVRDRCVDPPIAATAFAASFIGSFAGAETVMRVSASSLEAVIPVLIVAVAVITFIRKDFGATDRRDSLERRHYAYTALFGFAAGFYDGFFGPGIGSFLAFGFVIFFGYGFVRATGNAKVANLASNYAAILAFLIGGHIAWQTALPMGAANITGAWIGAGLAIRRGVRVIKPVFGVVLAGLLVKILFFS